jgi:hypothetical protein
VPLFNVPSCVIIADKNDTASIQYPLTGKVLRGKLDRKNESLIDAEKTLKSDTVEFSLHTRGNRSFWATGESLRVQETSYYKDMFAEGATIVPRSFWFVELSPVPLGFDHNLPPLQTAERARKEAKDAYKSVFLKDNVESRFLYATLLSTDLLPFGHLDYRMVVLPIEPFGDKYKLFNPEEARKMGFLYLSRWLEKAEKELKERRGSKAEIMNILERLDYRKKLTLQNPNTTYRVLYPASASFLCAAVVKNEPITFEIKGQYIEAQGFLADCKTYYMETSNQFEAYYVSSILNSSLIDNLIKPMQSRGLWGPRDIHKKVFELPIPELDNTNPVHYRLFELGCTCSDKVKEWLKSGGKGEIKSIGKLRSMVRKMLEEDIGEIDTLVRGII